MAMKAVSPADATNKPNGTAGSDAVYYTAPSVPVPKGQPPKASMIDGPFGGKKPA